MQIVEKKINEIKPYAKNPRKNDEAVEYVAKSIKEFGFKVPIVIDKNGVIVAGHTRHKAAKQLGLKTVPCIIADDLSEEQIKAFRLVDNKTAEFSHWDFDLLELEINDVNKINLEDYAFKIYNTDFDEDKLDDLFKDAPDKEKQPKQIQCPHCGEWFEI